MFSWKKEKDAYEKAVSAVQKRLLQGGVSKLSDKMRMRGDVVAVLKAHPNLKVVSDSSECLPWLVREKVQSWQGVNVLKITGHVRVESSSVPEYSIPLDIVVHPHFPSVPPVCFVTGDLYIPNFPPTGTLTHVVRSIISEFAASSVSRRRQRALQRATAEEERQVFGLILAESEGDAWAAPAAPSAHPHPPAAAAAAAAAAHRRPRHGAPRPAPMEGEGRGRVGWSGEGAEVEWEVLEAVRVAEEREAREAGDRALAERLAKEEQDLAAARGGGGAAGAAAGSGGVAKHGPLFDADEETPAEFVCPISLEVMTDPVLAADGHTYEREEIEDWFRIHSTSPLTNVELHNKHLEPNISLQEAIHNYFRRNDPAYQERFMHF